ncbi:MAG: hypothetical protein QOF66_172 [Mycobacterium sp.]|jgi:hypothetical protein|nr:hypothetical protein [Mycobacterium sp.]
MVTERNAKTPHSFFAQGRTGSVIVKPPKNDPDK